MFPATAYPTRQSHPIEELEELVRMYGPSMIPSYGQPPQQQQQPQQHPQPQPQPQPQLLNEIMRQSQQQSQLMAPANTLRAGGSVTPYAAHQEALTGETPALAPETQQAVAQDAAFHRNAGAVDERYDLPGNFGVSGHTVPQEQGPQWASEDVRRSALQGILGPEAPAELQRILAESMGTGQQNQVERADILGELVKSNPALVGHLEELGIDPRGFGQWAKSPRGTGANGLERVTPSPTMVGSGIPKNYTEDQLKDFSDARQEKREDKADRVEAFHQKKKEEMAGAKGGRAAASINAITRQVFNKYFRLLGPNANPAQRSRVFQAATAEIDRRTQQFWSSMESQKDRDFRADQTQGQIDREDDATRKTRVDTYTVQIKEEKPWMEHGEAVRKAEERVRDEESGVFSDPAETSDGGGVSISESQAVLTKMEASPLFEALGFKKGGASPSAEQMGSAVSSILAKGPNDLSDSEIELLRNWLSTKSGLSNDFMSNVSPEWKIVLDELQGDSPTSESLREVIESYIRQEKAQTRNNPSPGFRPGELY